MASDIVIPYSPTHTYRARFVSVVLLLGTVMAAGSWILNYNPAFSPRGISALIERQFLTYQFAELNPAPLSSKNASAVPVLTYHRIVSDSSDVANVTKSRFKDQMTALKKAGWETVTLHEFEQFIRGEITLPEKSFLLTFDDGAKDSYYPVDPILAALDYEAVNFIIVNSAHRPNTTYYLDPREIKRMLRSGRWSIGSHSLDGHRSYPTDASGGTGIFFADLLWNQTLHRLETREEFVARVRDDLESAKDVLSREYTVPIESFAFPLGNETGLEGADNFPEGSSITEQEAKRIYGFGYLQLDDQQQQFTANAPARTESRSPHMSAPSSHRLNDGFIVRRIHVDYDWDGARLVAILENSLAKQLPFDDDFSTNSGWIAAWGSYELGRNNFVLSANTDGGGAFAFLDGTQFWTDYSFDIAARWNTGWISVIADVIHAGTYHSCSYGPGIVRLQSTIHGETRTLKEVQDRRIAYGDLVQLGTRVHGDVIECTWNFQSVAEVYTRDFSGGVGIQTWDETPGNASVQIISAIARPFAPSER